MAAMALELGPPPKAGEERKSIGHVVLSALVCVPHAKGGEDEDDEEDEKKQENEKRFDTLGLLVKRVADFGTERSTEDQSNGSTS